MKHEKKLYQQTSNQIAQKSDKNEILNLSKEIYYIQRNKDKDDIKCLVGNSERKKKVKVDTSHMK